MTSATEPHANEAESIPLTGHVRGAPITGSRLQKTSDASSDPPHFTAAGIYLKWSTLPSRSRWETQNMWKWDILASPTLWETPVMAAVSSSEWAAQIHMRHLHWIKNITSVTEKCVFLALRFSERHMEAPICRLTGGIKSTLRYIKIPPSRRCERVRRHTLNIHLSLNSQSIFSRTDFTFYTLQCCCFRTCSCSSTCVACGLKKQQQWQFRNAAVQ